MTLCEQTHKLLNLLALQLRRPHIDSRISSMIYVSAMDSSGKAHVFMLDPENLSVSCVHRSGSTGGKQYRFRSLMDAVQYITHGFMVLDCMEEHELF